VGRGVIRVPVTGKEWERRQSGIIFPLRQRTAAAAACLCSNEEERWPIGPDGPKRVGGPKPTGENKMENRMVWFVGWAEC
jgi:hypothetical protein